MAEDYKGIDEQGNLNKVALKKAYNTALEVVSAIHEARENRSRIDVPNNITSSEVKINYPLFKKLGFWVGSNVIFQVGNPKWGFEGKRYEMSQRVESYLQADHRRLIIRGIETFGTDPYIECPPFAQLESEVLSIVGMISKDSLETASYKTVSTSFYSDPREYCTDLETRAHPIECLNVKGSIESTNYELNFRIYTRHTNRFGDISIRSNGLEFVKIPKKLKTYPKRHPGVAQIENMYELMKPLFGYFLQEEWIQEYIPREEEEKDQTVTIIYHDDRYGNTQREILPGQFEGLKLKPCRKYY